MTTVHQMQSATSPECSSVDSGARHVAQTVICAIPSYLPNKGLKQERGRHEIEEAGNVTTGTAKGIPRTTAEGNSTRQLSSGIKRKF